MTYQLTLFQQLLAWAAIVVIIEIILVPIILLTRHGAGVAKAVFWAMVIAIAAMILCIEDVRAMTPECAEYIEIVDVDEDQDMNRVYYVLVSEWVIENPTDSVCFNFGRCIYELISDSPAMAAVSIINPADQWIPSQWRWIEIKRAEILTGIRELEASYAYNLRD